MLHIMELAYYSVQYPACSSMVLAQMVVPRVRVRTTNMVWRNGGKYALGTCLGRLVAYRIGTCMDIGSSETSYLPITHNTRTIHGQ